MNHQLKANISEQVGNLKMEIELDLVTSGITSIYGRSGSGKTTFLRLLVGLNCQQIKKKQKRFLQINGEVWEDSQNQIFLPTYRRSVGYVFQEENLFPHLTIEQNLEFALRKTPKNNSYISKDTLVEKFSLKKILQHSPHQISGGERQRVALCRSLLMQPELLLLDEPLSALDDESKKELMMYLLEIRKQFQIPIILVSHSWDEVNVLSDRIIFLENGKVKEITEIKNR